MAKRLTSSLRSRLGRTAVLNYPRRYWTKLGWIAALGLIGAVAEAAILVLLAATAARLAGGDNVGEPAVAGVDLSLPVTTLIAIGLGAVVVRAAAQGIASTIGARLTAAYEGSHRMALLHGLLLAPWQNQAEADRSSAQDVMTSDVEFGRQALEVFVKAIASLAGLVVLVGSAILVNPVAAVAILASLGLFALAAKPLVGVLRRTSEARALHNSRWAAHVNQSLRLLKEIASYGIARPYGRATDEILASATQERYRIDLFSFLVPTLYQNAALLLVFVILAVANASGTAMIASIGAVVLLLVRSMTYGQGLQVVYNSLVERDAFARRLVAFEETHPVDVPEGGPGEPLPDLERIELRDVSYRYAPGGGGVSGVSVSFGRGELVGIVGPSGSGKSTLLDILLGLRDPQTGVLVVNGRPRTDFDRADWSRAVASCLQDSVLTNDTITANIRFHRGWITDAMIDSAAHLAGIETDIRSFPDGFDQVVSDLGQSLSGGQRQRISLARALAGQPSLLVLDEPTSALDGRAEQRVQQTLSELRGRTTTVVVSHRLSTLRACDRVLVVIGGELVDEGRPDELAERSPYFSEALRLANAGLEVSA